MAVIARGQVTVAVVADGANSISIYTRSQFQPTMPIGTSPLGWNTNPDAFTHGFGILWVSSALKNSDGILNGNWSNPVMFEPYSSNLLWRFPWSVGSGTTSVYSQNGLVTENYREMHDTPFGFQDVVWKGISNGGNDADGGFNAVNCTIDHTKPFRVSCWMRQTNTDGTLYIGVRNGSGSVQRHTTTWAEDTNFYYWNGHLPEMNKWYLLVGYVHGSGETTTVADPRAGMYDPITGKKVISFTAVCRNSVNSTFNGIRVYQYYCASSGTISYFWNPRVDIIDGREPSIEELLKKSKDGDNGSAGNWTSYVFKSSATQPATPTGTATTPSGWVDAPTAAGTWWMSKATVNGSTGVAGAWSVPIQVTGTNGTNGTNGKDGQYTAYNFAKNTSTTTAPTAGWAASPPALTSGEYLWMRTGSVVPPATAPATWNVAVRISGEKGDKGDKGDTGSTGATGATGSAGTAGPGVVYRGVHSASTIYYNNSLRRDIVKYGTTYYVYKGANGVAAAWNAANWDSFGAEFTSVATELLLAQLAYIENLGVKNLKTATAGQRVEITQANNALAFYDNNQSYPVVEIKTTSDSIYMGQGSGILIKHPNSNISINNGILQNSSEGSGVSVPILAWSQPETIAQNCILQSYNNSNTNKYKTGLYVDVMGTQSTAAGADKLTAIFTTAGMFMQGGASAFRSNNVLCGVTAAGRVSSTGSLLSSWVITFMGGYLTSSRTNTGRYRITFSNTSYLYGASDYQVFILPDAPTTQGSGAYGCTMARTSSYFDVWMADDASTNDCAFTFIVFLISKFF